MANRSQNCRGGKLQAQQPAAARRRYGIGQEARGHLLVAKPDPLSRSVAFIATLMNSRGFDLAIADMPGANRLTVHVLAAAAEHERHMIGECTPLALSATKTRDQDRQSKAGRDQPGEALHRGLTARRAVRSQPDLNARGIAAAVPGKTRRAES